MKESFCPILWQANGGQITAEGRLAFEKSGPAQGLCEEPYDCYSCDLMKTSLETLPPNASPLWVCPMCSAEASTNAKELGIKISVPGYYTEGYCQRLQCSRQDPEDPEARHSNFLQLLIVEGDYAP